MLGLGHIAKLKLSQPFDRFFILGYFIFIKLAHYCSACSMLQVDVTLAKKTNFQVRFASYILAMSCKISQDLPSEVTPTVAFLGLY